MCGYQRGDFRAWYTVHDWGAAWREVGTEFGPDVDKGVQECRQQVHAGRVPVMKYDDRVLQLAASIDCADDPVEWVFPVARDHIPQHEGEVPFGQCFQGLLVEKAVVDYCSGFSSYGAEQVGGGSDSFDSRLGIDNFGAGESRLVCVTERDGV